MKKILLLAVTMFGITTFAQVPSLREQLAEEFEYQPIYELSLGVGLDMNKDNCSFLIATQGHHIDFMANFSIINDKSKSYGGGRCENYTGIIGPSGFPGDRFVENYRTPPFSFGTYIGYLVNRFSFGTYFGYESYETGTNYYDAMHILSASGYYTVNRQTHDKFVFGLYSKFFLSPHGHIFLSYKFGVGFGFGLVFTFSTEC